MMAAVQPVSTEYHSWAGCGPLTILWVDSLAHLFVQYVAEHIIALIKFSSIIFIKKF